MHGALHVGVTMRCVASRCLLHMLLLRRRIGHRRWFGVQRGCPPAVPAVPDSQVRVTRCFVSVAVPTHQTRLISRSEPASNR